MAGCSQRAQFQITALPQNLVAFRLDVSTG
jgi:hypothetical protein